MAFKEKGGKVKVIDLQDHIFEFSKFYKTVKNAIEDEGYLFIEKEQISKHGKYGQESHFTVTGYKEWDEFVRTIIKIKIDLSDVHQVKYEGKTVDKGGIKILPSYYTEVDYEYKWNTNFKKKLFKIWKKYLAKQMLKKTYFDKADDDMLAIYKKIKQELDLYA